MISLLHLADGPCERMPFETSYSTVPLTCEAVIFQNESSPWCMHTLMNARDGGVTASDNVRLGDRTAESGCDGW